MPELPYVIYYAFHGLNIRIAAADQALAAAIDSRLRHFRTDRQARIDLSFEFYVVADAERHVVQRPPEPARPVYDPVIGQVVYGVEADQLYIDNGDQARGVCFPAEGLVRVSLLRTALDNLWYISHPMFTLPFMELMKRRERYALHAATLAVGQQGVIFPASSGSGKSTLTLALLRGGLGYLGDDMVYLTRDVEGVRALAFPDEIDVTDATARFFPELHHLLDRPPTPGWHKRPIWPEEIYGAEFVPTCRPAALIFPRIANAATSALMVMDRDEALLELTPNVLLTERRSSQGHLDMLGELVSISSCYRLETGRDFDNLPAMIRDVLRDA